jgi:hypothetical protein
MWLIEALHRASPKRSFPSERFVRAIRAFIKMSTALQMNIVSPFTNGETDGRHQDRSLFKKQKCQQPTLGRHAQKKLVERHHITHKRQEQLFFFSIFPTMNDNQNHRVRQGWTSSRVMAPPGGGGSLMLGIAPPPAPKVVAEQPPVGKSSSESLKERGTVIARYLFPLS